MKIIKNIGKIALVIIEILLMTRWWFVEEIKERIRYAFRPMAYQNYK